LTSYISLNSKQL